MIPHVLIIGSGVLADQVTRLLSHRMECDVIHQPEISSDLPSSVDLALVLGDGWNPSVHTKAEETFRPLGIPWLRGFVAFGTGFVGPLGRPGEAGCSQCADLRILMAEAERREMLELRFQFAVGDGTDRDVWATRSGLRHVAIIFAAEVQRFLRDVSTCHVVDHILCTNLKTLETTRHFILPNTQCPVCGSLPEDSPEQACIALDPSPKTSENSFRVRSITDIKQHLVHDYLDYATGLLNGKVNDLITPFAAVSVNLPLLMGDEGTSGRSHSYEECEWIAILEGLERFCGLEPRGKRSSVYDSYANLRDDALNPATVGLHSPEQYARPDFPYQPFDEDNAMEWVWGYSLTERRPILVPLRLAYYSLGCRDSFVYETSNGCALGSSLVEAIFHGILEVVERDAFLMTWYAKFPLPLIDLATTPDRELHWMVERLRVVAGYDLHFYNATMEHGIPTVFVIAKNRRPHGINLLCSAGAHLDPMRAVHGAIHETAGMLLRFDEKLENDRDVYLQMLRDPSYVRQMDDHSMLYGLPEAEERLSFLLDAKRPVQTLSEAFQWSGRQMDLTDDLNDLLDVFAQSKLDVVVVDQTSPELARNGLHCVKVLIPGMLPMTFGHHLTRLEGLDRVLRVPMELGYKDRPLKREELNPHPHPFP